ncbi:hypothetical protein ON010_g18810 [Phytophthora cinnamomi]|nr:hypothetical protein ON010_g18810 [Phytophthora cinnamomi]
MPAASSNESTSHGDNSSLAEDLVLWAHTASDGPLVAAWHSALLAATVSFAVASAAVRLHAPLCLASTSTAVADAMTSTVSLARALRKTARLRAAVRLAQSTRLTQAFAACNSTPRLAAMCTATPEADLVGYTFE